MKDLIGTPVLDAYKSSGDDGPLNEYEESYTWTFYSISTIKGSVQLRWYGSSNGYYSEDVDIVRLEVTPLKKLLKVYNQRR